MLSVSSKYALKALVLLAKEPGDGFIRVEQLSAKAAVPGPYLSKIMKTLAQKKLVETRKGLTGGVRLAKRRTGISFYDVCIALDDPAVGELCIISKTSCGAGGKTCPLHREWGKIRDRFHKFLKTSKIASTDGTKRVQKVL